MTITNSALLASGSSGVDKIEFSFCPSWDGFAKTVIFFPEVGVKKAVVLDNSGICEIPPEIILSETKFKFGVYGINENGNVITSKLMNYAVKLGAFTVGKLSDPTPDIYTQIENQLSDLESELDGLVNATAELESYLSNV